MLNIHRWLAMLVIGALASLAGAQEPVVVTGQVVYGAADDARRAAETDIVQVYRSNPAYMRIKQLGLVETRGHGKTLFEEAQAGTNRAVATVAGRHRIDVITVPGGVTGGEVRVEDLTVEVVDALPLYCVDGNVLHGAVDGARHVAEVDSQAILAAIPAYEQWQGLRESDANYHILRKRYLDLFTEAVKEVARSYGIDAIVEKGGVTSRLGPVSDLTRAAIDALDL